MHHTVRPPDGSRRLNRNRLSLTAGKGLRGWMGRRMCIETCRGIISTAVAFPVAARFTEGVWRAWRKVRKKRQMGCHKGEKQKDAICLLQGPSSALPKGEPKQTLTFRILQSQPNQAFPIRPAVSSLRVSRLRAINVEKQGRPGSHPAMEFRAWAVELSPRGSVRCSLSVTNDDDRCFFPALRKFRKLMLGMVLAYTRHSKPRSG